MKHIFLVLTFCAMLPMEGLGASDASDGNYLYSMMENCEKGVDVACMYSLGFTVGVINTYQVMVAEGKSPEWGELICFPTGNRNMTSGQMKDTVYKFLKDNPAIRHQPAAFLTLSAFLEVWYCPA